MRFEEYLEKAGKKIKETSNKKQCLSEEDIAFYFDGVFDDDGKKRIEKHISSCDICREIIEEHAEITGEVDREGFQNTSERIVDRTVQMMTPLVRGKNVLDLVVGLKEEALQVINTTGEILKGAMVKNGDLFFMPSVVGTAFFRSGTKIENFDIAIRKEFSDGVLTAEFNRVRHNSTDLTLHLAGKSPSAKISDIRVTMKKGQRICESGLIKYGRIKFEDIAPGVYVIYMKDRDGNLLGSVNLNLKVDE